MPAPERLTPAEARHLEASGYLLREASFSAAEVEQVSKACEAMVDRLVAQDSGTPKSHVGSYCFQANRELCTIVKWEPDRPDVVQGVEPFAHFDAELDRFAHDSRFLEPMRDLLGFEAIELFTEKLNVKRARCGGPIVLHQDYPYWTRNSQDPLQIATALLYLDDATRENGCLEVLPGSHAAGPRPGRDAPGFGSLELDPDAVDPASLVAVEAPAGSVVFLGSLLVHRSLPNRSPHDRRALLYSYQPAGRPHSRVTLAQLLSR